VADKKKEATLCGINVIFTANGIEFDFRHVEPAAFKKIIQENYKFDDQTVTDIDSIYQYVYEHLLDAKLTLERHFDLRDVAPPEEGEVEDV
jgi:hypothetical protein